MIAPRHVAAPDPAALTARLDTSPEGAGDDFGLLRALPLAIGGGLACWALIVWAML